MAMPARGRSSGALAVAGTDVGHGPTPRGKWDDGRGVVRPIQDPLPVLHERCGATPTLQRAQRSNPRGGHAAERWRLTHEKSEPPPARACEYRPVPTSSLSPEASDELSRGDAVGSRNAPCFDNSGRHS